MTFGQLVILVNGIWSTGYVTRSSRQQYFFTNSTRQLLHLLFIFRHRFCITNLKFPKFEKAQNVAKTSSKLQKQKREIWKFDLIIIYFCLICDLKAGKAMT
jgi:hypothetical protein